MKYLKVKLWDQEIGRLVWEPRSRRTYFLHNEHIKDLRPDFAPLLAPIKNRNILLPIYGDERPMYHRLPPFIADSLPDSWGNLLFERWIKETKIPANLVTPLYKLMFIGKRGMGALEFEPYATDLVHRESVDVQSLYDMSLRVLEDREYLVLNANDELTLQALLEVGTSAGGRQMKAILAINEETGEIRSGQTDGLDGFDYYILKFGDRSIPFAEIETAYHHMAMDTGIQMEECRLFPVEGLNHFLTRRFDRNGGRKIHMQTLAAINPDARSYEELIATCRQMSISESEIEQLFTRMAFNVMANNTDDHHKNFSFLLEENGRWRLSPAYDVTFIFNAKGNGPNTDHCLSIGGKLSGFTKGDLLEFAKENDIRNANAIIDRIAEAIGRFSKYADRFSVTQPWRSIIQKTLNDNLKEFGYEGNDDISQSSLQDKYGRTVSDFSISINSKGHYEVAAVIDGIRRRRFVRPNMELFKELMASGIYNLPAQDKLRLVEILFTSE